MGERFESKLPRGLRKHNRDILAKTRKAGDAKEIAEVERQVGEIRNPEEAAWDIFVSTLAPLGYPESFPPRAPEAVKEFFHLRRRIDLPEIEMRKRINEFQSKYPELLDTLSPIFQRIRESIPKPPQRLRGR